MVDPTGISGSLGAGTISGGIGWARNRTAAYKAIRNAIRETGLDPGTYRHVITKWLNSGGNVELAGGQATQSLTAALNAKAGDGANFNSETLAALESNLLKALNSLENGAFNASLFESSRQAITDHIEELGEHLLGKSLDEFCTIRTGKEIIDWVDIESDWNTLNSPLTGDRRPAYGPREHDALLDRKFHAAIANTGDLWDSAVIVAGPSKSGKTRSVLEAIRRLVEDGLDIRVIQPDLSHVDQAAKIANRFGISPSEKNMINIILIDDLQFLPDHHQLQSSKILDFFDRTKAYPRLFDWLFTPTEEVVVIAITTWPTVTSAIYPPHQMAPNTILDLLAKKWIEQPKRWSDDEFHRLEPAFQEALTDAAKEAPGTSPLDVAEAAVAAPVLLKRLTNLSDPDDHSLNAQELAVSRESRSVILQALLAYAIQRVNPTRDELSATYRAIASASDVIGGFDNAFRWTIGQSLDQTWAIATKQADGETYRLADFLWTETIKRHIDALIESKHLVGLPTHNLYQATMMLYALGEPRHSKTLLSALSNSDDKHAAQAMTNLGALEEAEGNLIKARGWYAEAAGSGQDRIAAQAMVNRGALEYEDKQIDKARLWWKRAVALDDSEASPQAMINLGILEDAAGELDTARRWYQKAADSQHASLAPGAMVSLGVLSADAGELDVARRWYKQAVESGEYEYSTRAAFNLGLLEERTGELDSARYWYELAVRSNHHEYSPQSMVNLGVLEYEDGRQDMARHWYEQGAKTNHHDQSTTAMFNLGNLALATKETASALYWWTQAAMAKHVQLSPKAMVNLGLLEFEQGNFEAARHWLNQAAQSSHQDVAAKANSVLRQLDSRERGC